MLGILLDVVARLIEDALYNCNGIAENEKEEDHRDDASSASRIGISSFEVHGRPILSI